MCGRRRSNIKPRESLLTMYTLSWQFASRRGLATKAKALTAGARRWLDGLFLLLPCAYFVLGTLLVNTSAIDTRARVMLTPLLAVMAAQGVIWWLERRR